MDTDFLEYWGNMLVIMAKSRRQADETMKLFNIEATKYSELNDTYREIFNQFTPVAGQDDLSEFWNNAAKNFNASFKDYLKTIGFATIEDYNKLAGEHEELKAKYEEQQETIKQLRLLVNEKGMADQVELVKNFQELMKIQGERFSETMTTMATAFSKKD